MPTMAERLLYRLFGPQYPPDAAAVIKDPLVRRFITGTVLTIIFVGVAIRFFNVHLDVVMGFLLGSFTVVGAMIGLAFVASLGLDFIRRKLRGDD